VTAAERTREGLQNGQQEIMGFCEAVMAASLLGYSCVRWNGTTVSIKKAFVFGTLLRVTRYSGTKGDRAWHARGECEVAFSQ
jgi:hypothetical protein